MEVGFICSSCNEEITIGRSGFRTYKFMTGEEVYRCWVCEECLVKDTPGAVNKEHAIKMRQILQCDIDIKDAKDYVRQANELVKKLEERRQKLVAEAEEIRSE